MDERQRAKGERFRALHAGEPFVIPNPWDAGTAKVMEALGFPALATTSSGFAFSLGRADGEASLEEVAEHTRALDRAGELPIAVDLENGHGPSAEDAAKRLPACAPTRRPAPTSSTRPACATRRRSGPSAKR